MQGEAHQPGEALLLQLFPLVGSCGQNQALVYLQARQLMHLGRFPEALQAVSGFLGGDNCDVLASRWAVHMTVHIHWLMGNLAQVRSAFCLGAAMTE